jgi:hypothetical protein
VEVLEEEAYLLAAVGVGNAGITLGVTAPLLGVEGPGPPLKDCLIDINDRLGAKVGMLVFLASFRDEGEP